MSLVFDKVGDGPKTHAIVIGIGEYRHFKSPGNAPLWLNQLESPPVSALAFAKWLVQTPINNPKSPLGSVELLISPSGVEWIGNENCAFEPATMENITSAFDRWLERCDRDSGNVAIFYYCGHGFEYTDQVLLSEDFGHNSNRFWDNSFLLESTIKGLQRCKAETKCFFVDACRTVDRSLIETLGVTSKTLLERPFRSEILTKYQLTAYATRSGQKAHAPAGGQVSYFTQALIDALDGYAAEKDDQDRWAISTGRLGEAINTVLEMTSFPNPSRQLCNPVADSKAIIHYPIDPPKTLVLLECDPIAAQSDATFYIKNDEHEYQKRGISTVWRELVESGIYDVGATFTQGSFRDKELKRQVVFPPRFPRRLVVR